MANKISVIMPVYNETLPELNSSIKSILNQTYKNFEYIIIDDNPKSEIIKRYLIKRSKMDNRIKLIFNKENYGTVMSANKGLRKATGKYIDRMDADDIAVPNKLWDQLKFCEQNNLEFCSCNYISFFGHNLKGHQTFIKITQVNQHKIKRTMKYMNLAVGPTLFFKRSILVQLRCYRNILDEDYDLAARALIHGYRIGFLSESLIYKRDRKESLSNANSLKEFVILLIIGSYLRKYDCTRVVPLSFINKQINNISSKNYYYYKKFLKASMDYKNTKNLWYNIKRYILACSTSLIFKRNLFVIMCKFIQNLLLR